MVLRTRCNSHARGNPPHAPVKRPVESDDGGFRGSGVRRARLGRRLCREPGGQTDRAPGPGDLGRFRNYRGPARRAADRTQGGGQLIFAAPGTALFRSRRGARDTNRRGPGVQRNSSGKRQSQERGKEAVQQVHISEGRSILRNFRQSKLSGTSFRDRSSGSHSSRARLSRSALVTTDTEDMLIAAAAIIGLSSQPKTG